jgi:hypothetical protein
MHNVFALGLMPDRPASSQLVSTRSKQVSMRCSGQVSHQKNSNPPMLSVGLSWRCYLLDGQPIRCFLAAIPAYREQKTPMKESAWPTVRPGFGDVDCEPEEVPMPRPLAVHKRQLQPAPTPRSAATLHCCLPLRCCQGLLGWGWQPCPPGSRGRHQRPQGLCTPLQYGDTRKQRFTRQLTRAAWPFSCYIIQSLTKMGQQ